MECLLCLLAGEYPPLESKLLGQQNVMSETGGKIFPSGLVGMIVSGIIPFSPFDSWTQDFWL